MRCRSFFPCWVFIAAGALLAGGCGSMHSAMNNQLGKAYYSQGNYAKARDEFRRAAMDDPWNADSYHNLAGSLKHLGDRRGAEEAYRQALVVDPSHQPSYHQLASLLKEQGRADEALDMMVAWKESQPYNAAPYVETAWLKRELGDTTGSEELLLTAKRLNPDDHLVTAQLGQLYQDSGQPDRAAAMYRMSLNKQWYQPAVQSRLASIDGPAFNSAVPRAPAVMQAARPYGYGPTATAYVPPGYSYAPAMGFTPTQSATAPMINPTPTALQPIPAQQAVLTDPAHTVSQLSAPAAKPR